MLALRDHFTTDDKAAIGYLDYSPEARKELAIKSKSWKCKLCPYDASERSGSSSELIRTDKITEKSDKLLQSSSTTYLFWIGSILLILSILLSYTFLYIT